MLLAAALLPLRLLLLRLLVSAAAYWCLLLPACWVVVIVVVVVLEVGVGGYRTEKIATNAVSENPFPFRAPPCAAGVGGYNYLQLSTVGIVKHLGVGSKLENKPCTNRTGLAIGHPISDRQIDVFYKSRSQLCVLWRSYNDGWSFKHSFMSNK